MATYQTSSKSGTSHRLAAPSVEGVELNANSVAAPFGRRAAHDLPSGLQAFHAWCRGGYVEFYCRVFGNALGALNLRTLVR